MEILYILSVIFSLLLIYWFFIRPKLNERIQQDEETRSINEQLKFENELLINEKNFLNNDIKTLKERKLEVLLNIAEIEEQSKAAGAIIYEQSKKIAEQEYQQKIKTLEQNFNQSKQEYQNEYLAVLSDISEDTKNQIKNMQYQIDQFTIEINEKQLTIDNLKKIAAAAIEANKRELEKKEQINFYKIILSEEDKKEITELCSIASILRQREPLDKVIWKTYYEKPTGDLINRVVGTKIKMGIYKITNLNNGMCYIGQSVNIADRWKTHIKAGLGIDSSNNKFYTALKTDRVENFSFEILEECDRAQLNEKEKFWIQYYQSETFGYNMTKGNK